MDRWIKEAIYIRKEQDKSTNRDEGSYQLSHVYDKMFAAVATSSGERKSTTSFQKATAITKMSTIMNFYIFPANMTHLSFCKHSVNVRNDYIVT